MSSENITSSGSAEARPEGLTSEKTDRQDKGPSSELRQLYDQLFQEFEVRRHERNQKGFEKYGAWTWLQVDTLDMACEEIIDLGNYASYIYVRVRLLQLAIEELQSRQMPRDGFIPYTDMWKPNT